VHKFAVASAVCLAVLAFAGPACAGSSTIKVGRSGELKLEFSNCGSPYCVRVLQPEDSARKKPCEAKTASNSKCVEKNIWPGLLSKGGDSKSMGLPKLDFLVEVGSKLLGEDAEPLAAPVPALKKRAEAPPQPAASPLPRAKKTEPQRRLVKAATPRIAKPEPTTTPQPVREATYNCRKYISQTGETVSVPCD
jgi:hypothetical protein